LISVKEALQFKMNVQDLKKPSIFSRQCGLAGREYENKRSCLFEMASSFLGTDSRLNNEAGSKYRRDGALLTVGRYLRKNTVSEYEVPQGRLCKTHNFFC
jgi:hypothetical protein